MVQTRNDNRKYKVKGKRHILLQIRDGNAVSKRQTFFRFKYLTEALDITKKNLDFKEYIIYIDRTKMLIEKYKLILSRQFGSMYLIENNVKAFHLFRTEWIKIEDLHLLSTVLQLIQLLYI